MSNIKIALIQIDWDDLSNFTGNKSISTTEKLIEEAFNTEPYIRIQGENRIWHKSEQQELLDHIQEHKQKGSLK